MAGSTVPADAAGSAAVAVATAITTKQIDAATVPKVRRAQKIRLIAGSPEAKVCVEKGLVPRLLLRNLSSSPEEC